MKDKAKTYTQNVLRKTITSFYKIVISDIYHGPRSRGKIIYKSNFRGKSEMSLSDLISKYTHILSLSLFIRTNPKTNISPETI